MLPVAFAILTLVAAHPGAAYPGRDDCWDQFHQYKAHDLWLRQQRYQHGYCNGCWDVWLRQTDLYRKCWMRIAQWRSSPDTLTDDWLQMELSRTMGRPIPFGWMPPRIPPLTYIWEDRNWLRVRTDNNGGP